METQGSEQPEDAATHDFGRVRTAVAGLERAIRSHRLHEGRGPTLEQHIDAATQQLSALLENGPLTLRVSSFGLLFGNRPLTGARGIDATWFGLFADSVRDLCFLPGISSDEVRVFVEVLCTEPEEGDDRVTLLWRREVHRIELFLSSLLPARLEPGPDGDIRLVTEGGAAALFEPTGDSPGNSSLAFSRDDPRALVGREGLSWIANVESQPFEANPWVEAALREGGARARGGDIGRFVDALLTAREAGREHQGDPPLLAALLENLLVRDPEGGLIPLLRALTEHSHPGARPILEHLARPEFMVRLAGRCDLDPEGLEAVVRSLGEVDPDGLSALLVELRSGDAQARFARLAGDSGGDVLPFYLNQLDSEDEREALGAVQALAALDGERGLPGLAKAMSSTSDRVRYQALRSLEGRYHPSLAEALSDTLEDPRRVQRLLALRMLEQADDPEITRAVIDIVKREDFLERDPEERATWLRSLTNLPADQSIDALAHLLGLRSAIRKKVAELQLVVVEQLAHMEQPRARQLLTDSKGRWQLARAVRKAIAQVLDEGGRA